MLGKLVVAALLLIVPFSSVASTAQPHSAFFAATSGAGLGTIPAGTVSNGEEPSILVDFVANTILVGDTDGVHRSTNGGTSWTHPSIGFLPGGFTDGRALAQDAAGTLYAATTQGQLIGVAKSTNGGATWTVASHVAAAASIADRPWLAAGAANRVALLYFGDANEECALSTDGGATWSTTGLLDTPNAGNAVMDPQGRLWYSDGSAVTLYSTPCTLSTSTIALPASGAQIFTQLALDTTVNPPDQFVAQPSTSNGKMQLRGHQGTTGSTWKTVDVSGSAVLSNTFGSVATKGDGSEIAVGWYGSSTAGNPSAASYPTTASWNVYVSRVTGFWTSSPTVMTTLVETGNHVGQFCMGGVSCTTQDRDLLDYMGLTYGADGRLRVVWGHDGATTVADTRFADLG